MMAIRIWVRVRPTSVPGAAGPALLVAVPAAVEPPEAAAAGELAALDEPAEPAELDEPAGVEFPDDEQPAATAATVSTLTAMPVILYHLVREDGRLFHFTMLRPYNEADEE